MQLCENTPKSSNDDDVDADDDDSRSSYDNDDQDIIDELILKRFLLPC